VTTLHPVRDGVYLQLGYKLPTSIAVSVDHAAKAVVISVTVDVNVSVLMTFSTSLCHKDDYATKLYAPLLLSCVDRIVSVIVCDKY